MRHDRVVVLLHLGEERVAILGEHVRRTDDGESATRSQQPRGLRVPEVGRDPVEGVEDGERVEARVPRLPALEIGDDEQRLGNVAARDLRQLRRQLDAA